MIPLLFLAGLAAALLLISSRIIQERRRRNEKRSMRDHLRRISQTSE
jgi:hypothetical protein